MIVQVVSDRQIGDRRDAELAQVRCRADARHHQQLRRLQRAGRYQHFTPHAQVALNVALTKLDSNCTPRFEDDLRRQRVGDDVQIRPCAHRRQVGAGGAAALAVLLRDLIPADALLRMTREIVIARQTCLLTRFDEECSRWMRRAQIGHIQRPGVPMQ